MVGGRGDKKRFQYCTDLLGQETLFLRALQGHSGRNLIDLTLQDNVLIPDNFFEYIYHIGCAVSFTLHHKLRIEREDKIQTDSILSGCESHGKRSQRSS